MNTHRWVLFSRAWAPPERDLRFPSCKQAQNKPDKGNNPSSAVLHPARHCGFTLIEVLVALAILAVVLSAALAASGMAANTQDRLRLSLLANWQAEDRITQHRLFQDWPTVGQSSGTVDSGGETLNWTETVSGTPNYQFRRIDVVITSARTGSRPLASLSALLTAPGT